MLLRLSPHHLIELALACAMGYTSNTSVARLTLLVCLCCTRTRSLSVIFTRSHPAVLRGRFTLVGVSAVAFRLRLRLGVCVSAVTLMLRFRLRAVFVHTTREADTVAVARDIALVPCAVLAF